MSRMVTFARRCVLLGLVAALPACESAPCTGDPRTDGLNCASAGVSSGEYQRRSEERMATAEDRQRQARDMRAENDRLQGRIASQRGDIDRLSVEVNRAVGQGRLSEGEAAIRRAQIERLRRQQATLQQQPGGENRELLQKIEALQREIEDLKAALARRAV